MKFVKFSIFALTMGLFIASCGNEATTEETPATEATTEAAAPVEAAPVVDSVAAPVDSMAK